MRSSMSKLMRQHCIYKVLITLVFLVTIITITYWTNIDLGMNTKKCFLDNHRLFDVDLLDDIMSSERKPQLGKTVFFHETSCANGVVKLNAR